MRLFGEIMRVYVCASKAEAQGFIEKFRLKKFEILLDEFRVSLWKNGEILLFVCGIKFGANEIGAEILGEILQNFGIKEAINFGICGCDDDKISLGSAFSFEGNFSQNGVNLICVSEPQTTKIAQNGTNLYDMESAKFAEICDKFGVSWKIYKIVSDHLIDAKIDKAAAVSLVRAHAQKIGEL